MPPHARMSLAQQQLLLRAGGLVLEASPTARQHAVRWGTGLHDRFLLPTFVQMDFDDVMEPAPAGFAFDRAWFAPHFEFRFPLGEVAREGIGTLRNALEPGM